jgi:26 proteasome complex subunit DSS1
LLAWTGEEEDQDENHIWQDDWDDDTVEDDFSNQLRYVNIHNWNEK